MHLDAGVLVYFIEDRKPYVSVIKPVFAMLERGTLRGISSFVTLLEVLVRPLREGKDDLADEYRQVLLNNDSIQLLPLDREVAEIALDLGPLADGNKSVPAIATPSTSFEPPT